MLTGRGVRRAALLVLATVVVLLLAGLSSINHSPHRTSGSSDAPSILAPSDVPSGPTDRNRPNIVFVLTDDLASNLVPYMPHVLALERKGMRFTNYTVTDSLCCPSRSSILTGEFPHNTGVFTNKGKDGGFTVFRRRRDDEHTFATALHAAGYRTALMGKYLNGYLPRAQFGADGVAVRNVAPDAKTYVPPGWSTWDVAGSGYAEFHYDLNENRHVVHYGVQPRDYLVDVMSALGRRFVDQSVTARKPFALELATFAPHEPYVPAPRDIGRFRDVKAPRSPAFNRIPTDAPHWLATRHPLKRKTVASIDFAFRRRLQAVQSVDRMIGALEQELVRTGQASNTYFVFSSDNGLHMGDYTLRPGKLTAFDIDVNVPLVVTGPGIPAGSVDRRLVQNIDLAPTFEAIAGLRPPAAVDGRSLLPLLRGQDVPWRKYAVVEHHGGKFTPGDPDLQVAPQGDPPTYEAIRSASYTYVRYIDGEREYYDRVHDPYEIHNIYRTLSPARQAQLSRVALDVAACHGSAQCFPAAGG